MPRFGSFFIMATARSIDGAFSGSVPANIADRTLRQGRLPIRVSVERRGPDWLELQPRSGLPLRIGFRPARSGHR